MTGFFQRLGLRRHPATSDLARRVKAEGLTYLNQKKLQRLEAELRRLASSAVPGAFLEFGVALGGSAILIATAARAAGRDFAGFDVFDMIPPPVSDKDDAKSRARYSEISAGKAAGIGGAEYYGYVDDLFGKVSASFAAHGQPVDGVNVRLVKGLFEETWPRFPAAPIAFAHIDCDWYDPVQFCLGAVAARLSVGGSILLDDYHDYGGCRTATDEFLAARRDFRRDEGANLMLRRLA